MSKLLFLLLCINIVYCASVHKREAEENQEYANGNEGEINGGENNKEVKDQKVEDNIRREEGNDRENKGKTNSESDNNPQKNSEIQSQNLYYLVPLATEFLYPVETYSVPIVYYLK